MTTELAIAAAHADGSADGGTRLPLAFGPLDAYSKLVVLILKFLILGTIYLYEKENDGESSGWKQMAPDPEKGEEDEIAE